MILPRTSSEESAVDRFERRHLDDVRLEPAFRRLHRAAQGRDGEPLRLGSEKLGVLVAAHPVGHRHRLLPHVLEPESLHLFESPRDCFALVLAAGRPRPDVVGELLDEWRRCCVRRRVLAKSLDVGRGIGAQRRAGRRGERGADHDGAGRTGRMPRATHSGSNPSRLLNRRRGCAC